MSLSAFGYYTSKARAALRRAGADVDADPREIAEWAQGVSKWDERQRLRAGILVDGTGAILAEVHRQGGEPSAYYVVASHVDTKGEKIVGLVSDLAAGRIYWHTGRRVVRLSFADVGMGAGGER